VSPALAGQLELAVVIAMQLFVSAPEPEPVAFWAIHQSAPNPSRTDRQTSRQMAVKSFMAVVPSCHKTATEKTMHLSAFVPPPFPIVFCAAKRSAAGIEPACHGAKGKWKSMVGVT
jgi:hypothetical protein